MHNTSLSEYQRSFREDQFNCSSTTYRNNTAFRSSQRRRFQGHSRDPFVWEDTYFEDDDCDVRVQSGRGYRPNSDTEVKVCEGDVCANEHRRPASVPIHQFKHDKWNRLYLQRQRGHLNERESQTGVDLGTERRDASCLTDRYDDDMLNDGSESSASHVIHRVNVPHMNKQTQTPECWCSAEKSPFAPYGYLNDEKETGAKKTFNVKAAKEIFSSALRAKMAREDPSRTSVEPEPCSCRHHRRAGHGDGRLTSSLPTMPRRDHPAEWQSEYEREYRLYDQSQYESAQQERVVRPHGPDLLPSTPRIHRSYLTICR